jgi:hypothetical protein
MAAPFPEIMDASLYSRHAILSTDLKIKLITHIHLETMLRIGGNLFPLSFITSKSRVGIKTEG